MKANFYFITREMSEGSQHPAHPRNPIETLTAAMRLYWFKCHHRSKYEGLEWTQYRVRSEFLLIIRFEGKMTLWY